MWSPRTAEELERAASEELLNEKARFEVKREHPASSLLEPELIVRRLLRRFFDALTCTWYDPFTREN